MTKKQGNDAKSEEKTPKTPKNDVAASSAVDKYFFAVHNK